MFVDSNARNSQGKGRGQQRQILNAGGFDASFGAVSHEISSDRVGGRAVGCGRSGDFDLAADEHAGQEGRSTDWRRQGDH